MDYENGEKTVMEKKQYTKCKHFLLFECFRINKRTAQLTKHCSKCLDNEKCTKKTENVNMAGSNKFVANAKEVKFVITTNEDQPVMPVVENGFARKICND